MSTAASMRPQVPLEPGHQAHVVHDRPGGQQDHGEIQQHLAATGDQDDRGRRSPVGSLGRDSPEECRAAVGPGSTGTPVFAASSRGQTYGLFGPPPKSGSPRGRDAGLPSYGFPNLTLSGVLAPPRASRRLTGSSHLVGMGSVGRASRVELAGIPMLQQHQDRHSEDEVEHRQDHQPPTNVPPRRCRCSRAG